MVFSENLRRIRLEQFLSQAELGRRAGLHALTVTRLESGASAPSTRTLRALAATLDVEPRALAAPEEVAELRRVLTGASRQPRGSTEELAEWANDGGTGATAAEPSVDSTNRPGEA